MAKFFYTRKEAIAELKKRYPHLEDPNTNCDGVSVRLLSKKIWPRRKKRYFVGSYLDWLNI